MPILIETIPEVCDNVVAENIMAKKVKSVNCVSTMTDIKELLDSTNHHGYPVLNSNKKVIGIIPRNFILVLIKKSSFY